MLTPELQAKELSDLWYIACIFVKLNTRAFKDETVAISSLAFLPIKAADSQIICYRRCIAV
jgi:hypothetical protein